MFKSICLCTTILFMGSMSVASELCTIDSTIVSSSSDEYALDVVEDIVNLQTWTAVRATRATWEDCYKEAVQIAQSQDAHEWNKTLTNANGYVEVRTYEITVVVWSFNDGWGWDSAGEVTKYTPLHVKTPTLGSLRYLVNGNKF